MNAPKGVPVPEVFRGVLRLLGDNQNSCLLRIGKLEAEYVNNKDRLFTELRTLRQEEGKMLKEAAERAGVDRQSGEWIFDAETMMMVPTAVTADLAPKG